MLSDNDRARLTSACFKQLWATFEFLRPCGFSLHKGDFKILLPDYCVREDYWICRHPIADDILNHWAALLDSIGVKTRFPGRGCQLMTIASPLETKPLLEV